MAESICLHYTVPGDDFTARGRGQRRFEAAAEKLGLPPDAVRKVSIALYEGEINLPSTPAAGISTWRWTATPCT